MTGPFDRERAPTGRMLVDEPKRVRVTGAVCRDRRFEDDRATDDLNNGKCVRIAVWVDTHDVVQLICKHPNLTSSRALGGHNGVGLGCKTAGGRTVTGHALTTRTGF
jgi:hypothetical protein